ncbi:hypothetical protein CMUS01_09996 [Colletotrichum musicola]|uniref:Uncharacterized protein n=1 Tax=Colletotrichum musicola TaxID=2175873 RepID=A0A8H6K4Q3_9PEZI|nr:hypothetical protein CMUS01_09996 [Colletotrichum musicola]
MKSRRGGPNQIAPDRVSSTCLRRLTQGSGAAIPGTTSDAVNTHQYFTTWPGHPRQAAAVSPRLDWALIGPARTSAAIGSTSKSHRSFNMLKTFRETAGAAYSGSKAEAEAPVPTNHAPPFPYYFHVIYCRRAWTLIVVRPLGRLAGRRGL